MKERKYIKFRVDMYEDTKFKIIDRMPERDLVHYVWTRVVALAGKVNLEGSLFMSKNIPYTVETLAIEFNRDVYQVKIAIDIFIELEMLELIEGNIYRVKNFAKHQNIRIKEKIKPTENEEAIKENEVQEKDGYNHEIVDNSAKESDNKTNQKEGQNTQNEAMDNIKITHDEIKIISDNLSDNIINNEMSNNKSKDSIPTMLDSKKNKKTNKKKKKSDIEVIDGEAEDNSIVCFKEINFYNT